MPRATLQLSDREAGQLARKAAEKIQEHGWSVGQLFADEGKVCLIGALILTREDGGEWYRAVREEADYASNRAYRLPEVLAFADHFGRWTGMKKVLPNDPDPDPEVDWLWKWNDGRTFNLEAGKLNVAPPDTQADILAALDKFACEMDPEGSYP